MQKAPDDSDGHQVLRHLRAIVAWHAAATSLLGTEYRHITQTLRVALVEVARIQPDLITDEEVIQEFFRRRPASSPETRACRSDAYRASYIFLPWLTFRQS